MSKEHKLLLCEDSEDVYEVLILNLKRIGYSVTHVTRGEDAIKIFDTEKDFDVAVLDVGLPGAVDGFQVCKTIREKNPVCGILMLTARVQEMDKVTGFTYGADDYITKPYSMAELTARVDALCRRVQLSETDSAKTTVELGPFSLNVKSRELTKNGIPVDLTQVEFQIIEYFMKNKNTAIDRDTLLKSIWGESYVGDNKIIDVNIRRIRMKIEDDPAEPKYIITVWGYGYKWALI